MNDIGKRILPKGWEWMRLGDVCEKRTGVRDPRTEPDKQFVYVDITSVDNRVKRIVAPKTLLGVEAPSRARQLIHKEDVLVSTTRPNLNAVAIVPSELHGQICSTGFCVLRARSILDPAYLYLYVQTNRFAKTLSDLVKGALYPAVTDKQVKDQLIPLPPLAEQKRIAAILNGQMTALGRARAAAEAQLEAAKALPATFIHALFNSPEIHCWQRSQVSQICEQIDYGFTASADFTLKKPRFLRISDIQRGLVDWESVPGCQISPKDETVNRLADGDIVFARTGATTGKSYLIRRPPRAVFASYLIRLRPTAVVSADYLYAFFQSDDYWRQIRSSARGGAQPNVNATMLGKMELPLPPLAEQNRIAAILAKQILPADRIRHIIEQQDEIINKLPAALLRCAFSGEL